VVDGQGLPLRLKNAHGLPRSSATGQRLEADIRNRLLRLPEQVASAPKLTEDPSPGLERWSLNPQSTIRNMVPVLLRHPQITKLAKPEARSGALACGLGHGRSAAGLSPLRRLYMAVAIAVILIRWSWSVMTERAGRGVLRAPGRALPGSDEPGS